MPLLYFVVVQMKIWNLNLIFADCNDWKCLGCFRWKRKEGNAENERDNVINTCLVMLLLARKWRKEKKKKFFLGGEEFEGYTSGEPRNSWNLITGTGLLYAITRLISVPCLPHRNDNFWFRLLASNLLQTQGLANWRGFLSSLMKQPVVFMS